MPTPPSYDGWYNALRSDHVDLVRSWIEHDPRPATVEFPSGRTLLTLAAEHGAEKCLAVLLPHSDPCYDNGTGDTPMMGALHRKSSSCAQALLFAGGPQTFDTVDSLGRTPLHVAAENGMATMVRTWMSLVSIEQKRENVQAPDLEGKTPLHEAAAAGHIGMLELLTENIGTAGLALPDNEGWTPLMYAVLQRQDACARFLAPLSPVAHANEDGNTAISLADMQGGSPLAEQLEAEARRQEVEALRTALNETIDDTVGPGLSERGRARL